MGVLRMSWLTVKNLFSRPATRRYPKETREPFEATRGEIRIDIEACIFCSLCSRKCPTQALKVSRDNKSWTIDPLRCIVCRYCVEVCPKKCLAQERLVHAPLTAREKLRSTKKQDSAPAQSGAI